MGVEALHLLLVPGHPPDPSERDGVCSGASAEDQEDVPWPDCRQWSCSYPGLLPDLLLHLHRALFFLQSHEHPLSLTQRQRLLCPLSPGVPLQDGGREQALPAAACIWELLLDLGAHQARELPACPGGVGGTRVALVTFL